MARKKVGGGYCSVGRRLALYCTVLAAVCFVPANGDSYIVRFNQDAMQSTLGVASEYMTVSARNDAVLDTAFGLMRRADTQKMYDYSAAFSGVALTMSPEQRAILESNPLVMSVVPDREVTFATTHSYNYMALQNAWARVAGNHSAGEDVVIGLVDSGIYPDHASFAATDGVKAYGPHPTFKGACATDPRVPGGFCNGKIVGAQYFFKSAKAGGAVNITDPDVNSPLDGDGHGTHTAGTAAGNYGVPVVVNNINFGFASGSAPRARLAIYKALTKDGNGTTADVIAAIDQAVKDGVDVLSLSLGSAADVGKITFTDMFEIACLGAVKAGVFVVKAAGNSGPETSSVGSWSPWLTTVGATTMDRSYPNVLYTGDGKTISGQGLAPPTPGTQTYPLISATDTAKSLALLNMDFDCADPTGLSKDRIQGKILVCTWNGVPSFDGDAGDLSRKAAQAMGAVGVVLVTKEKYLEPSSPAKFDFQDYPGISIDGAKSYESILNYLTTANAPVGRIGGGATAAFTGLPPLVAHFSSRGPNIYYGVEQPSPTDQPVADVLKPNIVAPGVDIWAAASPLSSGGLSIFQGEKFAMMSGTSMATPHLAGVAAIVRQAHPDWTPAMIASALASTAIPLDSLDNPLYAYEEETTETVRGSFVKRFTRPGNAFDFGGGFVDAATALNPGLVFEATYTDYIKFLCSIKELSPAQVRDITSETCPAAPGLPTDLNLPDITVGTLDGTRVVPRTVTNVGSAVETYTVVVNEKNPDVDVTAEPATFAIAPGGKQLITFTLKAVKSAIYVNQTSFGRVYLSGNLGHTVKIPVTVTYRNL